MVAISKGKFEDRLAYRENADEDEGRTGRSRKIETNKTKQKPRSACPPTSSLKEILLKSPIEQVVATESPVSQKEKRAGVGMKRWS